MVLSTTSSLILIYSWNICVLLKLYVMWVIKTIRGSTGLPNTMCTFLNWLIINLEKCTLRWVTLYSFIFDFKLSKLVKRGQRGSILVCENCTLCCVTLFVVLLPGMFAYQSMTLRSYQNWRAQGLALSKTRIFIKMWI